MDLQDGQDKGLKHGSFRLLCGSPQYAVAFCLACFSPTLILPRKGEESMGHQSRRVR